MTERRPYSPIERERSNYRDWSDDEQHSPGRGREKFQRERSLERDHPEEYGHYEHKKRIRRSRTPPGDRRPKRRPSYSPPMYGRSQRDRDSVQGGDHYIPNYDRDGYRPRSRPGSMHHDVMRYPNISGRWSSMPRMLMDIDQLDRLVSFQEFCDYMRHTQPRSYGDDGELQNRYAKYKDDFTSKQLTTFFNSNKDKKWFQEKYHPQLSQPRIIDLRERRQHNHTGFMERLQQGEYDNVNHDEKPQESSSGEVQAQNTEEGYESFLVIKTVPPSMSRQSIIEMCKKVDGFEYVALSEPNPTKKFHRIGWIRFAEGTDMQKAFDALDNQKVDDFVFHLAMNKKDNSTQSRESKLTLEISNTTERLKIDLDQSRELVEALDGDLGLNSQLDKITERARNATKDMMSSDDDESERTRIKKELDMLLTYLREVHMLCYYCGVQYDSSEELVRRCFYPHCRKTSTAPPPTDSRQEEREERKVMGKMKELDQRIRLKIRKPEGSELKKLGGKLLEDEFAKEHVQKEHEAKYKCKVGDCAKAFKGFEFVWKHIQSKHSDAIKAIAEETDYFNNYVSDPSRLLVTNPGMPAGGAAATAAAIRMHNGMNSMSMPPGTMMGMPWDGIPRIGFNDGPVRRDTYRPSYGASSSSLDDTLPRDPRQVKSYVDLDAPAEGDTDISFF